MEGMEGSPARMVTDGSETGWELAEMEFTHPDTGGRGVISIHLQPLVETLATFAPLERALIHPRADQWYTSKLTAHTNVNTYHTNSLCFPKYKDLQLQSVLYRNQSQHKASVPCRAAQWELGQSPSGP